jgi:hypothetical protein
MPADSGFSPVWMRVCAWCGIILPGDDLASEFAGGPPRITHGICPECRDELIRAVAAERAARTLAGPSGSGTS